MYSPSCVAQLCNYINTANCLTQNNETEWGKVNKRYKNYGISATLHVDNYFSVGQL